MIVNTLDGDGFSRTAPPVGRTGTGHRRTCTEAVRPGGNNPGGLPTIEVG